MNIHGASQTCSVCHYRREREYVKLWGGRRVRKSTIRRTIACILILCLVAALTYRAVDRQSTFVGVVWDVAIALLSLLIPTV